MLTILSDVFMCITCTGFILLHFHVIDEEMQEEVKLSHCQSH